MLSADLADGVILIPFAPPKSSHQNRSRPYSPTGLTIPPMGVSGGFSCPDIGLWHLLLPAAFP